MGATEHRMETTYHATIIHFTILPRLFVTYTRGEALSAQDREGYLVRPAGRHFPEFRRAFGA